MFGKNLTTEVLICLAILIPLIQTRAAPGGRWIVRHFLAPPPVAFAPASAAEPRERVAAVRVDNSTFTAPRKIPPKVALFDGRESRPTYLNGRPVPVVTQVEVHFSLRG